MSAIVVSSGPATVEVSPALQAFVDRMIRTAAPKTVAHLEKVTTQIRDDALAQWPRRTGKSAAGLTVAVRVRSADPLVVEGVIYDPVKYVWYIRSKKVDGNGSPWVQLVAKPLKKLAREVAETLAHELAAAR